MQGEDWTGKCEKGVLQSPIDIPAHLFLDKSAVHTFLNDHLHGTDILVKLEYSSCLDFFASYSPFENKTIDFSDPNTIKIFHSSGSLVLLDELD